MPITLPDAVFLLTKLAHDRMCPAGHRSCRRWIRTTSRGMHGPGVALV